MVLTEREAQIEREAMDYASKNKKTIARELTSPEIFPPEENAVSVFMAGSPGAGKTEASRWLLAQFEGDGLRVLCIDPDELRCRFAAYDGTNSFLFQGAVSTLVNKIVDFAYDQRQSFLLDGTLSNYDRAEANVRRALKHGRTVQILYVYLDPLAAWGFVQDREALEGRRIPPERFIQQYFAARDVVNTLKRNFGSKIRVDLLQKPIDGSERLYKAGIDQIDNHVPEKYDRSELERLLGLKKD
jgi:UDP-N-acetylglucosamine kinase